MTRLLRHQSSSDHDRTTRHRNASPRQEAARHGRCRAASPASPSGSRGYTGLAALQRNAAADAGLPAGGGNSPSGSRRWRAARWRRVAVAEAPIRLPDAGLQDADGARKHAGRLARPHRAAQPVGHLVRALPQGDAGARRAAGQARRTDFEVVAVNIDTRDPDKPKAWLKEVGIDAARLLRRSAAPRCSRTSRRPARRSACRPRC